MKKLYALFFALTILLASAIWSSPVFAFSKRPQSAGTTVVTYVNTSTPCNDYIWSCKQERLVQTIAKYGSLMTPSDPVLAEEFRKYGDKIEADCLLKRPDCK